MKLSKEEKDKWEAEVSARQKDFVNGALGATVLNAIRDVAGHNLNRRGFPRPGRLLSLWYVDSGRLDVEDNVGYRRLLQRDLSPETIAKRAEIADKFLVEFVRCEFDEYFRFLDGTQKVVIATLLMRAMFRRLSLAQKKYVVRELLAGFAPKRSEYGDAYQTMSRAAFSERLWDEAIQAIGESVDDEFFMKYFITRYVKIKLTKGNVYDQE